MFSNHDLSFVVNLTGRAQIFLRDAETMKRVWNQITDKSRAFFLGVAARLALAKSNRKLLSPERVAE